MTRYSSQEMLRKGWMKTLLIWEMAHKAPPSLAAASPDWNSCAFLMRLECLIVSVFAELHLEPSSRSVHFSQSTRASELLTSLMDPFVWNCQTRGWDRNGHSVPLKQPTSYAMFISTGVVVLSQKNVGFMQLMQLFTVFKDNTSHDESLFSSLTPFTAY